tara:strand:- start:255 stop:479 length:225 start_codon:yes stop_codon:yes gene_type:complete
MCKIKIKNFCIDLETEQDYKQLEAVLELCLLEFNKKISPGKKDFLLDIIRTTERRIQQIKDEKLLLELEKFVNS